MVFYFAWNSIIKHVLFAWNFVLFIFLKQNIIPRKYPIKTCIICVEFCFVHFLKQKHYSTQNMAYYYKTYTICVEFCFFEIVQNVVILVTSEIFNRVWCALEMTVAMKKFYQHDSRYLLRGS